MAARQAWKADAAKRAEQSSAAKRKATEAQKAAEAQVDAEPEAPKAESGAIASATQEANAQTAAQQVEDPPTPSKKSNSKKKIRDGPRHPKCPMAVLSKEDAEWAHWPGRLDMGADKGPSDSGSST